VDESPLEARLAQALELSADQKARSRALGEIATALRERRLHVRTCAWCGSISLGAGWHRVSSGHLVEVLSRDAAATHGICPTCFGRFLPGVVYPGDSS
jgi:hypothetical protein